jgi:thiamine biosynthesis lipoprotein
VATTDGQLRSPRRTAVPEERPALPMERRSFRSMGTAVTLIAPEPQRKKDRAAFAEAFDVVRKTFDREDERFSRFRPSTEISRVNAAAGWWTQVTRPFMKVLLLALEAARVTDGLFDPTVLPALLAAGYDGDFDDVVAGARLALNPPEPCGRWTDIEVRDSEVRFPAGVAVDFGGIAKGWTVDRAAKRVKAMLPWALVDAGGDLRIVGEPPPGGLAIGVEDPFDPAREVLRLQVARGALATSSVTTRSWGPGMHHLIDPRTSTPAATGILQATVWAPTCSGAEMGSKWALLEGDAILERLPAVLVHEGGTLVTNLVDNPQTRELDVPA